MSDPLIAVDILNNNKTTEGNYTNQSAMKRLLDPTHPIGKLKAGTVVRGIIKEIHPPAAVSEDKQRVVLMWPTGEDKGIELGFNLIGEHLHLDPDKCGKAIEMTADKDSTFYLSKFDDGGRFLTVRDGVRYTFRDPAPGTVPTVDDRINMLATHYVKCMDAAHVAIENSDFELVQEEVQKLAMAIWIDTKHQARIKVKAAPTTEPDPIKKVPTTPMPPKPEGPKEGKPPSLVATDDMILRLMKMCEANEDDFVARAAKAYVSTDDDPEKLRWRNAFTMALSSINRSRPTDYTGMPIYQSVLNACHNEASPGLKERIDGAINHVDENMRDAPDWQRDLAVVTMIPDLAKKVKED